MKKSESWSTNIIHDGGNIEERIRNPQTPRTYSRERMKGSPMTWICPEDYRGY
jgi:hypothetical protein